MCLSDFKTSKDTLTPLLFFFTLYRLFSDMVIHFPLSQEEITLSTTPHRVSLRNYYEEGNGEMKILHFDLVTAQGG